MVICKICGKDKPHNALGMCKTCYEIEYKKTYKPNNKILCKQCGEIKQHYAHGLCVKCYLKEYHKKYIKKEKIITCVSCHKKAPLAGHGMCKKCYFKNYYLKTREPDQYTKNKKCTQFLGVHVAERVLNRVFKDVERMNMSNPGYDFICNHGKKIDVKSSCEDSNGKKWSFIIKKNKIADFFLCIAFDNRESLTPQHLWLIPGDDINTKTGVVISKNTVDRWSVYEIDIERTLHCCNSIKNNKPFTK